MLASSLAFAQANETKGLDIWLISEQNAIVPGSTFTVGLHIKHHAGFHTYWKNPGVVGMATAMEWTLPTGFKASEIQWPHPEITTMASHPCHGYERDVVLLVDIKAPKTISTKTVTLTAKTRWMCCAVDCHPGFKDFTITLPVAPKAESNKKLVELFKQARKELPETRSPWNATVLSKIDQTTIKLKLSPKQSNAPKPDYVFSEDGQISSDKKQIFRKLSDGSYLLTISRSEFSPKEKTQLPAVVKAGKKYYFISPSYFKTDK